MRTITPYRLLLLFTLAIGLAGYAVWPREPVYEDRDLSAWLGELVDLAHRYPMAEDNESARRAWQVRHEKAVSAVRAIGAKALPHLLRRVRSARRPSPLREKLEELLDKQSLLRIKLPQRPDHTEQFIQGFRALGSAAEPALPELRRLLHKPATWAGAAVALGAIGPAAVPVLAPELTNSNCPMQSYVVDVLVKLAPSVGPSIVPVLVDGVTNPSCLVHAECLTGLGNLGPMAREFAPWLGALAQQPGSPLAGLATRVVGEVSDTPEQYLPLFSDRLNDTNLAAHAAFALGRMGPAGVPPLLRALTNQEPRIRGAALAALQPKLRTGRLTTGARSRAYHFSNLSGDFDRLSLLWMKNPRAAPGKLFLEDLRGPIALEGVLDHPNSAVRLQIVQLLARYGRNSAIGLSRATADTNESVRAEARAVLAALQIEVHDGVIIRGPTDQRRIALIFAGHEYAEGGETILNELAKHKAQASFFLSLHCLSARGLGPLIGRLYREGHYLGPHPNQYSPYYSAEEPKRALVRREQFDDDFRENLSRVNNVGGFWPLPGYFLPPQERCNLDIAEWASNYFYAAIGSTPGTRSIADRTGEADPHFVSSKAIFDSIVAQEQLDPHGLNGWLLLLHLGSGPGRADKFHARFGELLDCLTGKGYQFVAVDELFNPQGAEERRRRISQTSQEPPTASDAAAREAFKKRYGLEEK